MRIIKFMSFAALGLVGAALIAVKLIYGGGQPHPDVSTAPLRDDLEVAIELPFPPGMVAAGPNGEIFYTYHPFHAPQDHTDALLFGWEDGRSIPIGEGLGERLHGVFGITVDTRGWVWAVRPGAMEGRPTEVLAIDQTSGTIEFEFEFPDGMGGFAQDLRVSDDLRYVYLADTGLLRFTSASLIVLDTEARTARSVLVDHDSTAPQNWVMRRTDGSPYRLGYGLVTFQVGVDGLEITEDGEWLIYATMTHDSVYRVPTRLLNDPAITAEVLEASVELIGPGPMSDGIALDADGAVILTDVENGGLMRLSDGRLETLVRDGAVDWADSVTVAPNGDIWFTDSALTLLLDHFGNPPSREDIEAAAPYAIYRLPSR
ncbi:MAG: L-dopachrome tautomerase-related protein [Pseudomonadota bacterium]